MGEIDIPFFVACFGDGDDDTLDPLAAVLFHLRLLVGDFCADEEFAGTLRKRAFGAFGASFLDFDGCFFGVSG